MLVKQISIIRIDGYTTEASSYLCAVEICSRDSHDFSWLGDTYSIKRVINMKMSDSHPADKIGGDSFCVGNTLPVDSCPSGLRLSFIIGAFGGVSLWPYIYIN